MFETYRSPYDYFLQHLKVIKEEYKIWVPEETLVYTANVLSNGKITYLGDFLDSEDKKKIIKELADNTLLKTYFFDRYKRFFKLNDLVKLGKFYYSLAGELYKNQIFYLMSENLQGIQESILRLKERIKKERELYKLL